ncbi:tetratricopeptide repeat protein [Heyndrickxia sp. NPDC080065]|uniref:tetratricopeptide repeat protein n=1 Tax=Heyndrickxia sp. NPDC080065 TaxID=3390568 RepID=UPI003D0582D7
MQENLKADVKKSTLREGKKTAKNLFVKIGGMIKRRIPRINAYHTKLELAKTAMKDKDWKQASHHLFELIHEFKPNVDNYVMLGKVLRKDKQYQEAEKILNEGQLHFPNNHIILTELAKVTIDTYNWVKAREILNLAKTHHDEIPVSAHFGLSIVNRVLGNDKESNAQLSHCLDEHSEELKETYKKGYRKIILYNNGENRIEYYKMTQKNDTVTITFDSINMVWDEMPFGFKFLKKQNTDIIAVRRRTGNNYYQDLSLEDFNKTVNLLVHSYKRKVAYGFSLGGYAVLYYCADLNCEILSLSPRNSAHPNYGDKLSEEIPFKHNLSLTNNPNITPIIIYDPKNRTDNSYIEKELKKSFLNARFIEHHYAGHRTAPFLSQIGVIKDLVGRVVHGKELIEYDKKLRSKSHQYLRVLGQECLRRNKGKWALELSEKALELSPEDSKALALKEKAIVRLESNKTKEYSWLREAAIQISEKKDQIIKLFSLAFIELLEIML